MISGDESGGIVNPGVNLAPRSCYRPPVNDETWNSAETTLAQQPPDFGPDSGAGTRLVPSLTLLHHTDSEMIGARCLLVELSRQTPVAVSRRTPVFESRDGEWSALSDPHLSRRPSLWLRCDEGGLTLAAGEGAAALRVDGEPFTGVMPVAQKDLERGLLLSFGERVSLLLHYAPVAAESDLNLGILGSSHRVAELRATLRQVAALPTAVLLRGESGTGKELAARALHQLSPRSEGPFVAINMATLSRSTAAAELFGHTKGAFTGAASDRLGLFRAADGGTLFLDEIGETPAEVQAMLLRVLEEGAVLPMGADQSLPVDVRIVAATDAPLERAVEAGTFRGPLLHRLSALQVFLPSLRERRSDIGVLFQHFATRGRAELELPPRAPGGSGKLWPELRAFERLVLCSWPGNVRQLQNVARQLVVARETDGAGGSEHELLDRLLSGSADTPPAPARGRDNDTSQDRTSPTPLNRTAPSEISEAQLVGALKAEGWGIAPAARRLGISRTSLYALMDASEAVRKPRDLSADEIEGALADAAGDRQAAAQALQVSERGLRLRMTELALQG